MMADYGISTAELDARLGRYRVPNSRVRALYMDPATGATWSGWGRRPRWLFGRDPEAFRIEPRESVQRAAQKDAVAG